LERRIISRKEGSLKSEKDLMKFKYRETGENWNGPTMMEKVDIACYIVGYISHVLFSGLSNKSILSSISFDWICALSSVAPEVATVERSYSINYEIR
jgi:hypothetical protein